VRLTNELLQICPGVEAMESLSRAGRFAVIGRRFNHARGFIDVLARFLGRPARSTLRQIRTGIGSMERSALLSRDTPNKNHSTRYLRRLFVTFLSLICHRAVSLSAKPHQTLKDYYPRRRSTQNRGLPIRREFCRCELRTKEPRQLSNARTQR
jgi:hypothetical protein